MAIINRYRSGAEKVEAQGTSTSSPKRTSPHTPNFRPQHLGPQVSRETLKTESVPYLTVHAFRWALGPSQIPRHRRELYFPPTMTGTPSQPYGFPRAAHQVPNRSLMTSRDRAQSTKWDHKAVNKKLVFSSRLEKFLRASGLLTGRCCRDSFLRANVEIDLEQLRC